MSKLCVPGTSFEISLLPPFINFSWACVGRTHAPVPFCGTSTHVCEYAGTLVRELAIKEAKGVTSGVEQLKTDVQTVIVAMRSYRSPIGGELTSLLFYHLSPNLS